MIDSRESFRPPGEAVLEKSRNHIRALMAQMQSEERGVDPRLTALYAKALGENDYEPAVLGGITVLEEWPATEFLTVSWPQWKVEKTTFPPGGKPTSTDVVIHLGPERVRTQTVGGVLSYQMRIRKDAPEEDAEGYLVDYLELRHLVSRIVPAESLEDGMPKLGCEAIRRELRGGLMESLKNEMLMPAGLSAYPGYVELTTRQTGERIVRIEWFDCSASLVHRDVLDWSRGRRLPNIHRDDYLPGTDFVAYSLRFSVAEDRTPVDASEEFAWEPLPGHPVLDGRFGARSSDPAPVGGSLPGDEEPAERLEGTLVDVEDHGSAMMVGSGGGTGRTSPESADTRKAAGGGLRSGKREPEAKDHPMGLGAVLLPVSVGILMSVTLLVRARRRRIRPR